MTIWEAEKEILKAQTPQEMDEITNGLDKKDLQNIIKLLVDRMTPENVKINRFLNRNETIIADFDVNDITKGKSKEFIRQWIDKHYN